MTSKTTLGIVGATTLAMVGLAAGVRSATTNSATSSTVSVPAPQNLRAYEVGPDYVKVAFGPSVVGPLQIEPAPNGRSATIRWGGSTDALYPTGITYTFTKNGTALWKDKAQTYAVVGFTKTVRQFTTCVTPHSQSGFGPNRCVTWTAPAN